jgi:hypothetical protein
MPSWAQRLTVLGHLEELGDLGGAQVAGLGWLGHRALPFLGRPRWGSDAIEGSTQAGHVGMGPDAAWLPRRCRPGH